MFPGGFFHSPLTHKQKKTPGYVSLGRVGELNQSIDVKGKWEDFEDPDRSWIGLVLAIQSGNGARVSEILAIAKRSKWTHEEWDLAITADEDWTPEHGFGSDTEDYSEEPDGEPAAGSDDGLESVSDEEEPVME